MVERINRRKFLIKAFDIETHNDEESIAKRETSMWLGCYIDENSKVDDESSYLYTMDDFINKLEEDCSKKRTHKGPRPINNICIYVYNLSFEWSFLLPVLIDRGWKFKEIIEDDDEYDELEEVLKSFLLILLK